ncbi:MAG TPA: hypothetical protein VK668_20140 [Mucilaginibacter sp.]|nr:hypothetical protein [Mucilaginibacter sp.]
MNFFFDYIYFRITKWKYKSQGSNSATAISFIAVMQTMFIEAFINPMFKFYLTQDYMRLHARQLGWIAGVIFVFLMFVNYRIFDGKYEQFEVKWKDETPNKRFYKGVLVVFSFFIPIILFYFSGKLVKN